MYDVIDQTTLPNASVANGYQRWPIAEPRDQVDEFDGTIESEAGLAINMAMIDVFSHIY